MYIIYSNELDPHINYTRTLLIFLEKNVAWCKILLHKMKIFIIILCASVFLTACSTPLGRFNKQQAVVAGITKNVDENKEKQIESGRTFVYAADQALQKDPAPSKHATVAKQMTTRSITALGPPNAANALRSDEMVGNLLSEDSQDTEKGQEILSGFDRQLVEAQNQNRLLQGKLSAAETKLEKTNQENALMATKYQSLMHKVYWIMGGVIFLAVLGVGLKVAGTIAPFALPARGASSTLLKLVKGIQNIRSDHGADKAPALAQIDNHLKNNLDEKDRWMITQAKKKLNMI
ncbi:hypothetical protein CMI37_10015 [Candidatus Pacearchaeota archaeon]|nr:hypothetical protein [Candidatus Pacearchaeota archaeon]